MALDGWFLNFAQGSNWIGWEREQTTVLQSPCPVSRVMYWFQLNLLSHHMAVF